MAHSAELLAKLNRAVAAANEAQGELDQNDRAATLTPRAKETEAACATRSRR